MVSYVSGSRSSCLLTSYTPETEQYATCDKRATSRFLLCPEMTVQRWDLICDNSSFPYASNPAVFFICDKLQATDFSRISPCAIFMLYFVKQTCSAANVAQDPAELLLQPHRISYLVGLQLLKISTPYVLVPFTCFCFPFSPISHVLY